MQQIAEWLQRIIAVIILAGFLEMLLPENELRNVSRVIMGLLIITMFVQPLLQVFDLPQDVLKTFSISNEMGSSLATNQIIQEGLRIRNQWSSTFERHHKTMIEAKIKNLVSFIDEVQLHNVHLGYHNAILTKTTVRVKPAANKSINSFEKKRIVQKIIAAVQLVTNLMEDQIEVIWNG